MKIHLFDSPNIGKYRELKFLTEKYWKTRSIIDLTNLKMEIKKIKIEKIYFQIINNLNYISLGDFTIYDNILDFSCLINSTNNKNNIINIKKYFILARGDVNHQPSKMTKFFNTNYHYIIPENFKKLKITNNNLINDIIKIIKLGILPKIILIGPITYLYLLNKKKTELKNFIEIYLFIIKRILNLSKLTIQIDEPILSLKLNNYWKKLFLFFYENIQKINFNLIITNNFEEMNNIDLLNKIKKCTIHFSYKFNNLNINHNKSYGIISNNLSKFNILKFAKLKNIKNIFFSLKNYNKLLPIDLSLENNNEIKKFSSFFFQKINELKLLKNINLKKINFVDLLYLINYSIYKEKIKINKKIKIFKKKIKTINKKLFSFTSIGSLPQNIEIRLLRKFYNKKIILYNEYISIIKEYVYISIIKQIKLKINLLVNGEFERSDMVEYFSNFINGMFVTKNGWVQSYGTRYIKPPIIMNVKSNFNFLEKWLFFLNKITNYNKKIILSGPITITKWSFILNEKYKFFFCYKISEIINNEIINFQKKGFNIFQIDEPTIKECLPINIKKWKFEINNFLFCFNNSIKNIKNNCEIHSHICYSIFNNIINIISKMEIDVLTIESNRENMDNLFYFKNLKINLGGGLYDVHSPIIPYKKKIKKNIFSYLNLININKIWLNPDCGLKTRNWYEITFFFKLLDKIKKKILNFYS